MKYNILGYLIGEGFSNVFKNKKSTGASLMIMCATMIIFGVFLILSENINHFVQEVEEAQGIQVFATDEATDEQIKQLGEEINKINGVNTTEYVSKEKALDQMKERFAENEDLLDGYDGENNIFTASYIVTLTDLTLSQQVQDEISGLANVKKITSSNETVSTLIDLANGIKIVTGVILALLIIISIINNNIQEKYFFTINALIMNPLTPIILLIFAILLSTFMTLLAYRKLKKVNPINAILEKEKSE